MGMSLSGINIYTKNPAQSFNFYKGLGWEVVEEGIWKQTGSERNSDLVN